MAHLTLNRAAFQKMLSRWLPKSAQGALANSAISFLGLLLVGLPIFGFNRNGSEPFLGADTLFAVVGAVLLIASGPAAWVNRVLLSNRLAVFIGLISYSLYLWHWPLLSFLTIADGKYPQVHLRVLAVVLSFVLATLTYRFVEQLRRSRKYRGRIAGSLVAGIAILILVGVQSRNFSGNYDSYSEQVRKVSQVVDYAGYPRPDGERMDEKYQSPTLGHNDQARILIIGDSHATQYRNAVAELLKRQAAANPNLPEVIFLESSRWGFSFVPSNLNQILNDKAVSGVVLSNFWALRYVSDKVEYSTRGMMIDPLPLTSKQMDELDNQLESMIAS
jgi:hypothetical protein